MKRSKTDWTSGGSEAVTLGNLPLFLLVAGLAGEHDAGLLARAEDLRLDRPHVAPAGVLEQRLGRRERLELLEVLDCREDEQQQAVAVRLERVARRRPAEVHALVAVDRDFLALGHLGQEEMGVEAGLHHR